MFIVRRAFLHFPFIMFSIFHFIVFRSISFFTLFFSAFKSPIFGLIDRMSSKLWNIFEASIEREPRSSSDVLKLEALRKNLWTASKTFKLKSIFSKTFNRLSDCIFKWESKLKRIQELLQFYKPTYHWSLYTRSDTEIKCRILFGDQLLSTAELSAMGRTYITPRSLLVYRIQCSNEV